jgi:hypothetical protein
MAESGSRMERAAEKALATTKRKRSQALTANEIASMIKVSDYIARNFCLVHDHSPSAEMASATPNRPSYSARPTIAPPKAGSPSVASARRSSRLPTPPE